MDFRRGLRFTRTLQLLNRGCMELKLEMGFAVFMNKKGILFLESITKCLENAREIRVRFVSSLCPPVYWCRTSIIELFMCRTLVIQMETKYLLGNRIFMSSLFEQRLLDNQGETGFEYFDESHDLARCVHVCFVMQFFIFRQADSCVLRQENCVFKSEQT